LILIQFAFPGLNFKSFFFQIFISHRRIFSICSNLGSRIVPLLFQFIFPFSSIFIFVQLKTKGNINVRICKWQMTGQGKTKMVPLKQRLFSESFLFVNDNAFFSFFFFLFSFFFFLFSFFSFFMRTWDSTWTRVLFFIFIFYLWDFLIS